MIRQILKILYKILCHSKPPMIINSIALRRRFSCRWIQIDLLTTHEQSLMTNGRKCLLPISIHLVSYKSQNPSILNLWNKSQRRFAGILQWYASICIILAHTILWGSWHSLLKVVLGDSHQMSGIKNLGIYGSFEGFSVSRFIFPKIQSQFSHQDRGLSRFPKYYSEDDVFDAILLILYRFLSFLINLLAKKIYSKKCKHGNYTRTHKYKVSIFW